MYLLSLIFHIQCLLYHIALSGIWTVLVIAFQTNEFLPPLLVIVEQCLDYLRGIIYLAVAG